MATLVTWNPMRDMFNLRKEIDRVFDTAFDTPAWRMPESMNWGVAVDLAEEQDRFIVKATVPGVQADDIDVTVNDNILTIKGEFRSETEDDNKRFHIRERRFGQFSRSFTLPSTADLDRIDATLHEGVLTLAIPKTEAAKPRRITVNTNGQPQMIEG